MGAAQKIDRIRRFARSVERNAGAARDATHIKNVRVLRSLLGPAVRGFVLQRGKSTGSTSIPTEYQACFKLDYDDDHSQLRRLYHQAKRDQWNADTALDWSIDVDPQSPDVVLLRRELLPFDSLPGYASLPAARQRQQEAALLTWLLSQFLHGEQGALFAACQVTECVEWMDGKLYGSTQVVDEGRHVEVFSRYLDEKLGKIYEINDNLYVIIDALMTDGRWDLKFLGMQIMIEGLALAAFGTLRQNTDEPLLKELLRYVITDEARHVHFGVVALEDYYRNQLTEAERREREEWAFEVALLMRNRFLVHEFYDEYWAHKMSRKAWDEAVLSSEFMASFRRSMYRRIIPNLKRIGLLSDRVRPYYAEMGLLELEDGKAAPDLTAEDMLLG